MDRREFIDEIARKLRQSDARKYIKSRSTYLKITGENGQNKTFKVSLPEAEATYTRDDVSYFYDAMMEVINECVENNEPLNLRGQFQLYLSHKKGRPSRDLKTGEPYISKDKYALKFRPGKNLALAVIARSAKDFGCSDDIGLSDIDYSGDEKEADAIFDSIEGEDDE